MARRKWTWLALLALGAGLLTARSPLRFLVGTATASSFTHSIVSIAPSSSHLMICPQGDGQTLAEVGATISIQAIMDCCWVVPGILPEDIWVVGCSDAIALCSPPQSASNADAIADAEGMTTMSGTIKGGGSDSGLFVAILGSPAQGDGTEPTCLPVVVSSPDINGDLTVDVLDLSLFAASFSAGAYDSTADFNGDGVVDVIDFAMFSAHFMHGC